MKTASRVSRLAGQFARASGLLRWRERRHRGGAILMYHGVQPRLDDPELEEFSIDAATLRRHLQFLKSRGDIVSIEELLSSGDLKSSGPLFALTFDDALRNQIRTAAEVLSEFDAPWALCVPAGLIGTGRTVRSYELRFLLLRCWKQDSLTCPLLPAGLPMRSPAERLAAYGQVQRGLFRCLWNQGEAILEELIDAAGRAEFFERLHQYGGFDLASWPEIQAAADAGATIVSHGWVHRPLSRMTTSEEVEEEIVHSRRVLESRLGVRAHGFSAPFGVDERLSESPLVQAGYSFGLTSRSGWLMDNSPDWFALPRFDAHYDVIALRRHLLRHAPLPAAEGAEWQTDAGIPAALSPTGVAPAAVSGIRS